MKSGDCCISCNKNNELGHITSTARDALHPACTRPCYMQLHYHITYTKLQWLHVGIVPFIYGRDTLDCDHAGLKPGSGIGAKDKYIAYIYLNSAKSALLCTYVMSTDVPIIHTQVLKYIL